MRKNIKDLSIDQIIIMAASYPDNNDLCNIITDKKETMIDIIDFIITGKCLSDNTFKTNPIVYKGSENIIFNIIGLTNYFFKNIIKEVGIKSQLYVKIFHTLKNNTKLLNELELDIETMATILSPIWEYYPNEKTHQKISTDDIKPIFNYMDKNTKKVDEWDMIFNIMGGSNINPTIAYWLLTSKNAIKNVSISSLSNFLIYISPFINDKVEVFTIFIKNLNKRFEKSDSDEKEDIEEMLIEYEYESLCISSIIDNFKITQNIMGKLCNEILKIKDENHESVFKSIIKAINNKTLIDDTCCDLITFSATMNYLTCNINNKVKFDKLNTEKIEEVLCISVVENAINNNLMKKIKVNIKFKIGKFNSRQFRKIFTGKALRERYDEIKSIIEYLIKNINDNDIIAGLKNAMESVDNDMSEFNSGNLKKRDLIAKMDELLKDLREAKTEYENQFTSTDDDFESLFEEFGIADEDREDLDVIKKAYKKWIKQNHPDKFLDEDEKINAEEKVKIYQRIYDIYIEKLKNNEGK